MRGWRHLRRNLSIPLNEYSKNNNDNNSTDHAHQSGKQVYFTLLKRTAVFWFGFACQLLPTAKYTEDEAKTL